MKKISTLTIILISLLLISLTSSSPAYSQCDPVNNINCFQCTTGIFNRCVVDFDYANNIYSCQPDHTHVDEVCTQHHGDPDACLAQTNNDCKPLSGIIGYFYRDTTGICYPCFSNSIGPLCNPPEYTTLNQCEAVPDPTPILTIPPFEPNSCSTQRCLGYAADGTCYEWKTISGIQTGLGCIPTHPFEFIRTFRGILISIASGISLLLMVIGSFFVLTSKGNQEQIQRGKEIFTSALIGLLMLISSVFLLRLISVDLLDLL